MRRITLSLPTEVATRLRSQAHEARATYLDLIRGAYVDRADAVARRSATDRRRGAIEAPRPARRWPPGRVQIALRIPEPELRELDRAADALGLDRSGYVAELLSADD